MQRVKIVKLLQSEKPKSAILIKGWVRTRRDSKDFSFIEVNDGSCLARNGSFRPRVLTSSAWHRIHTRCRKKDTVMST